MPEGLFNRYGPGLLAEVHGGPQQRRGRSGGAGRCPSLFFPFWLVLEAFCRCLVTCNCKQLMCSISGSFAGTKWDWEMPHAAVRACTVQYHLHFLGELPSPHLPFCVPTTLRWCCVAGDATLWQCFVTANESFGIKVCRGARAYVEDCQLSGNVEYELLIERPHTEAGSVSPGPGSTKKKKLKKKTRRQGRRILAFCTFSEAMTSKFFLKKLLNLNF